MRLNKYLQESEITLNDDELVTQLKAECSEWLKESNGVPVYRGINRFVKGGVEKLSPRTDRHPRDTESDVHTMVDVGLEKKFGWRPRSEGVFVTADDNRASKYGFVNTILPVNGYKYVWSPRVEDLYLSLYTESGKSVLLTYIDKFISLFLKDENTSTWARGRAIERAIKTYIDTNLKGAIKSGNELTIKCKEYYIVDSTLYEKIKRRLI